MGTTDLCVLSVSRSHRMPSAELMSNMDVDRANEKYELLQGWRKSLFDPADRSLDTYVASTGRRLPHGLQTTGLKDIIAMHVGDSFILTEFRRKIDERHTDGKTVLERIDAELSSGILIKRFGELRQKSYGWRRAVLDCVEKESKVFRSMLESSQESEKQSNTLRHPGWLQIWVDFGSDFWKVQYRRQA